MPRMLILDGNSLANRAFYALPPLTTADGRPTNVLHGFLTMLFKLEQEQHPDYWVVAFDKTKATVRIEQYAGYKAQRKETPEGLRPQFDYLKEILADMDVPLLELAGYEADDLIAAITKQAEAQGMEIQIYTGDKDALQLISPRTNIFLTKKGISEIERYDETALWERYQLRPHQIIDLKGLMGDTSDNIPGVPGIGEKTALKLLWEFETVENVLANVERVSGKKVQSNLKEYADQAILSKKLATMLTEVPLTFSSEDFVYRRPQASKVLPVLQKYDLRNVTRLWHERHNDEGLLSENSEAVLETWPERAMSEEDWLLQIDEWKSQKKPLTLACRYKGTGLQGGQWLEWGVAAQGETFILDRDEASEKVCQAWLELMGNDEIPKTLADSKTVALLLANEGVQLKGLALDLSLASYLIQSSRPKFAPLDLVKEYFPSQDVFANIAEEAAALAQVAPKFEEDISTLGLTTLLHEIEEPLSLVLAQMERHGIAIDSEALKAFGDGISLTLKQLEQDIYALAEETFNINSTKQLGTILFEKLGLPSAKKTKTGYSTDAETLEELRIAHPVVAKILDYRQLNKLMSTYVNGLLAQAKEGRIHTTFQQTVTTTGRLSSTEPNLQNIPIRLEQGRQLRKVFHPTEPGWVLLSADYSQIELRILAHYSQDPLLCESFALRQDVHTRTAAEVFGISLEEVTSDMRRSAKAVNFGLVYGLTEFGLSRDLGIPRKESKFYIEQYFKRYSGVKRYLEDVVTQAKTDGQVRTLLNRLRRIPELLHSNRVQRQFGERIAMNTPVQGTAADIMKLAMLKVAEGLKPFQATMLLQVHDELLLQVAPADLENVARMLKEQMENAYPLTVPMTVECKVGPNWYEMQPFHSI
ncbi:DNA polymerase I [Desulfosporosinus meridiei]|uniref:DNA polymerase I n=1 Tax=Desulfosporosinus meridiei (strain ATCC BAA-275 / DSM 13257 / KCTC 12902 / NCIMB 13706 / S10) TaxID=768704 RepID=J7IX63_DESMD|nr:DNA polymerase I [Desulfosporosinus meridiei]AFQ44754.1 DNA polymerase I [Desulfosporosinus meridiei DSM 13257]